MPEASHEAASPSVDQDKLSIPAQGLYFLGLPLTTAGLFAASPVAGLCTPFVCVPTIWLLRQRSKLQPNEKASLESLIWTFLGSGTIGPAVVVTMQSAVCYGSALLLFGPKTKEFFAEFQRTSLDGLSSADKMKRADIAWTWQYFAFLLLLTFAMAGGLEEAMKYLAVLFQPRKRSKLHKREYLQHAVASALGFSTIENIGFIYAASKTETVPMIALTLLERVVIAMPGHVLTACLIAIKMIRRDVRGEQLSLWQILAPSIIYHGAFDFALFSVSAWDGNVGWIHPSKPASLLAMLTPALGLWGMLWLHVRREMYGIGLGL